MNTPAKRCPAPGCRTLVHPNYFMCCLHWRQIPGPLQKAIWLEYRLRPGSPAHLAACRSAIKFLSNPIQQSINPPIQKSNMTTPSSVLCRLSTILCLLASVLCLHAGSSVTLAWDPSPGTNQIASYHIYYGSAHATYTNYLSAGTNLTLTVTNLLPGKTYYFAATATDTNALESDYSNEVSCTTPQPPGAPPSVMRLITQP